MYINTMASDRQSNHSPSENASQDLEHHELFGFAPPDRDEEEGYWRTRQDELQVQLNSAQEALSTELTRIQILFFIIEYLKVERDKGKETNMELQNRFTILQERKNNDLIECEESVIELKRQVSKQDLEITLLQMNKENQSTEYKSRCAALQLQLDNLKTSSEQSNELNRALQTTIQTQGKTLETLQTQIKGYEKQLQLSKERTVEEERMQRQTVSRQYEEFKREHYESQEEITKENQKLRGQLKNQEWQLYFCELENEDIKRKLKISSDEINELYSAGVGGQQFIQSQPDEQNETLKQLGQTKTQGTGDVPIIREQKVEKITQRMKTEIEKDKEWQAQEKIVSSQFSSQITRLETENENLKKQIEELTNKLYYDEDFASQTKKSKELTEQIEQRDTQIIKLQTQIEQDKTQIKNSQNQFVQCEIEIQNLQSKNKELEDKLNKTGNELTATQSNYEVLDEQLNELIEENKRHKEMKKSQISQNSTNRYLETSSYLTQAQEIEEEKKELNQKILWQQQQIQNFEQEKIQMQNQINKVQEQNEQLQQASTSQALQHKLEELEKQSDENKELKTQIYNSQVDERKAQNDLRSIRQKLSDSQAKEAESQRTIQRLRQDLKKKARK